jgi:hypothetical protein
MMVGLVGTPFSYFLLPVLVIFGPPMRARICRGGVFWISGCSPAFLDELATSLAEQRSSVIELKESDIIE